MALLLVLILAFSLCACGKKKGGAEQLEIIVPADPLETEITMDNGEEDNTEEEAAQPQPPQSAVTQPKSGTVSPDADAGSTSGGKTHHHSSTDPAPEEEQQQNSWEYDGSTIRSPKL